MEKTFLDKSKVISDISFSARIDFEKCYRLQGNFLGSNQEFRVFEELKRLLAPHSSYYIFPQAVLRDFVKTRFKSQSLQNRIQQKSVDFLICRKNGKNLTPTLVVEVQGLGHYPRNDDFKKNLFSAMKLDFLRIHIYSNSYDDELKDGIQKALSQSLGI